MAAAFDSNFSFNQQLWYYYTTNRGKIRSRYNDLTRKFLAYNDSEENPHAFLRKPQFEALEMYVVVKEFMSGFMPGEIEGTAFLMHPIMQLIRAVRFALTTHLLKSKRIRSSSK